MIGWNKSEAEAKASKGSWASKGVRIDVFKNNCAIFRDGGYVTDSGKVVEIPVDDPMLAGTKVYSKPFRIEGKKVEEGGTKTGVMNADSFDVAEKLISEGMNPAVLNLADAYSACGMLTKGSKAQEESLCRTSTLSRSLYQYFDKKFADLVNVRFVESAYPMDIRNGGIYSPEVTVFRRADDWFRLLDKPFKVGVISVAALDFNEKHGKNLEYESLVGGFTPEGLEIMKEKVRTIYRIGLDNGHDSLVLGAFGCGAFNLNPSTVAGIFSDILEEDEFRNMYKAVYFAILERASASEPTGAIGKFASFYRLFGTGRLKIVKKRAEELAASVPKEYSVGQRVNHKVFGLGTIVSTGGDRVEVDFDSAGRKTLAIRLAKLTAL